jgi:N-acetylmuramoyl-L-alanine amidase
VKARLIALGATVYMTRSTDTGVGPCVDYRGRFGQRVHAMLKVSVHADGSARTDRGFVVLRPAYIRGFTDDIYSRSYALAKAMRTGMLRAGLPIANYYAINGIRTRSDFANFNLANVPSILVETGNMKNASDARRMKSSAGRDQYAAGLVNGIRLYLGR